MDNSFAKSNEEDGKYPIAEKFKANKKLKPKVELIGQNGNIFNLISLCRPGLRNSPTAYNEMRDRVLGSNSYDKALSIIQEYVDIV